jgi:hypothetical protein
MLNSGQTTRYEYAHLDLVTGLKGQGRPPEPGNRDAPKEFEKVVVLIRESGIEVHVPSNGDSISVLNSFGSDGWLVVNADWVHSIHPVAAGGSLITLVQEVDPEVHTFLDRFERFLLVRSITS